MAMPFRVPSLLRGVPGRLGAVLAAAVAAGTWLSLPVAEAPQPPAFAGKHSERLAFLGDESEIPVREARVYDTIAMFAQPRVEPRPWSEAPVTAAMREAGIKLGQPRPAARAAAGEAPGKPADDIPRLIQLASAERARFLAAREEDEADRPVTVFGWDVPGSRHLPSRRDAARVFDRVGGGAAAIGSGAVRTVSRSASAVGDGVSTVGEKVASTGGALARTLGFD